MRRGIESRFGKSSTGDEVIAGHDLHGTLAVVTGAGGIGRETALAFARMGADIILGSRRDDELAEAKSEIARAAPGVSVYTARVDLSEPRSIVAFADTVTDLGRPVGLLINNAGVAGCPLAYNSLGVERHIATNFLGHALLSTLLVPALRKGGQARIVCLTSSAHQFTPVILDDLSFRRRPYDKFLAYAQSKTACVLHAIYLGASLLPYGITVHAVHPGVVQTDIIRHLTDEDREMLASLQATLYVKTIAEGAATTVWAAVEPQLGGVEPLYLEDCGVAPVLDLPADTDYGYGVLRHALDRDAAKRLWLTAEKLLGRSLLL